MFKKGQAVYDELGHQLTYVAAVGEQHAVQHTYEDFEGEVYASGPVNVVDKVWPEAPRVVYDQRIRELQAQTQAARDKLQEAESELRSYPQRLTEMLRDLWSSRELYKLGHCITSADHFGVEVPEEIRAEVEAWRKAQRVGASKRPSGDTRTTKHTGVFSGFIGKKVVVRDHKSGVWYGRLDEVAEDGRSMRLSNARRAFYWTGAATCSGLAVQGPATEGKICSPVKSVVLCEPVEVLRTTKAARKRWREAPEWIA